VTKARLKAVVIAGPVLDLADPVYREVQIPRSFWKIVVLDHGGGSYVAAGYILSQGLKIEGGQVEGASLEFDPINSRVPISEIERRTGLDFGDVLRRLDNSTPASGL
jgi:endonuclease G